MLKTLSLTTTCPVMTVLCVFNHSMLAPAYLYSPCTTSPPSPPPFPSPPHPLPSLTPPPFSSQDGDPVARTDCYHYFHTKCLTRYYKFFKRQQQREDIVPLVDPLHKTKPKSVCSSNQSYFPSHFVPLVVGMSSVPRPYST